MATRTWLNHAAMRVRRARDARLMRTPGAYPGALSGQASSQPEPPFTAGGPGPVSARSLAARLAPRAAFTRTFSPTEPEVDYSDLIPFR
jgi:hypothetical protein